MRPDAEFDEARQLLLCSVDAANHYEYATHRLCLHIGEDDPLVAAIA